MKVSELIPFLQAQQTVNGDLPIAIVLPNGIAYTNIRLMAAPQHAHIVLRATLAEDGDSIVGFAEAED